MPPSSAKCFQKQQFYREMVYGCCNSQHFGFCLLNVQFSVMNQIEILNIYINVSALMLCAGNIVQCLVNIVHYLYTFVGDVGNWLHIYRRQFACISCKQWRMKKKIFFTYYTSSPIERFDILSEKLFLKHEIWESYISESMLVLSILDCRTLKVVYRTTNIAISHLKLTSAAS